ncbi:ComEA family DNA-binding protein [Streptomyces sp. NPDC046985]|uniref:ComEA family DNA-binding protein n=1 Tax=Streptomyces sp. NPDC046985 TaxID=3155377 RepID=UPI0033C2DDCD
MPVGESGSGPPGDTPRGAGAAEPDPGSRPPGPPAQRPATATAPDVSTAARRAHAVEPAAPPAASVPFGAAAHDAGSVAEAHADRFLAADSAAAEAGPSDWRDRAVLALRERMPLWVQTRCELERRHVIALAAVFALAAILAVQHFWTGRTQTVHAPDVVRAAAPATVSGKDQGARPGAPASETTATATATATGPAIVVDVGGKVRHPGIRRLPAGSRVADALRAAGGARPGTDLDGLNRARFLVDGEQVVVGGPAPVSAPAPGSGAGGPAGTGPAGAPQAPVPLSTATAEQLEALPGVGPVLAQHIVEYRTQHGGFRSVDELRQVSGIGDRRYADLRSLVTS